jgi:hypothetical protein
MRDRTRVLQKIRMQRFEEVHERFMKRRLNRAVVLNCVERQRVPAIARNASHTQFRTSGHGACGRVEPKQKVWVDLNRNKLSGSGFLYEVAIENGASDEQR